jgi:hypothetical protein
MKALKMILALVALTLLASCVSTPQSKPQTREELLAAGWQEVSAEKISEKNLRGKFQSRFKPIEVLGRLSLQNLTMGRDDRPEPHTNNFSITVRFEKERLATFKVKYHSSKRPYTITKREERWLKSDTFEIHDYAVTKNELNQLLANPSSGVQYPVTNHKDKSGSVIVLPGFTISREAFLEDIAQAYALQKQAYIDGKLSNAVGTSGYENQERQLLAASIILGDTEFQKLVPDRRQQVAEAARQQAAEAAAREAARRQQAAEAVAREEARKQTLITTAFSGNTSFDTNHARNLSMLNNPSYWKKDTIYMLYFPRAESYLGQTNFWGITTPPSEYEKSILSHSIQRWIGPSRFVMSIVTTGNILSLVVDLPSQFMVGEVQNKYHRGLHDTVIYFKVKELQPVLVLEPILIDGEKFILKDTSIERFENLRDMIRKAISG